MPNPLTLSDAPDITDKKIQKFFLKSMPHKGKYTKEELKKLSRKGIKPGTKKAHKAKRTFRSDTGYMKA